MFLHHLCPDGKGDKVMVNTPVYDPFFKVIEQQERTLVTSSPEA